MLGVDCSVLAKTLMAMHAAAQITVINVCPSYVQLKQSPPGVVLDFAKSSGSTRLDVDQINNITIENFTSVSSQYSALNVVGSSTVRLISPRIVSPGSAGITVQGSNNVEISGAWITGTLGDGIDIAGSTNVFVHDGACEGNVPSALYHPDCVQLWSVTGHPVRHVTVQDMTAIGFTQGFDLWDHSNFGASDIKFLNNTAAINQYNCIGAHYATQLVITGNHCFTLPGSVAVAGLNVQFSPNAVIKGNVVGASGTITSP